VDNIADIIARLKAGEQIPGWTYSPATSGLYGESQVEQREPATAFYNGQAYFADDSVAPIGTPFRNQTLNLKDVAKLGAIMGTAAFGGSLLAGGGGAGAGATVSGAGGSTIGSLGTTATQLGAPLAELGAASVPMGNLTAGLPAVSAGAAGAGGSMWQYLIPAAAQLIGAGVSSNAAKSAAATSAAASDKAIALQERIYNESIGRQQPFLQGGTEDYNRLRALMSGGPEAAQNFLQMDPGYQFRLSEGLKALDRQAAARGGLISGGALKAAQRYGQDAASQEFGAAYNRLANLANIGPQAAGVMSNLGQNYASNVGNIYLGQGNTAANAQLSRGSTYGNALNQLGYLAGQYYGQPSGTPYTVPNYPGYEAPPMQG